VEDRLLKRTTTTDPFLFVPHDDAEDDGTLGELGDVEGGDDYESDEDERRPRRGPAPRSRRR